VSFVDVDEQSEIKILLADNRLSDLATYDDALLAGLLRDLPDLSGTLFSPEDLDALDGLWTDPPSLTTGSAPETEEPIIDAEISVGPYRMLVDRDPFNAWATPIEQSTLKPEESIRRRLDLPTRPRREPKDPETTPVRLSTVSAETIPINSVVPYPGNARQGDIGAISESLTANGQYRPIVVNRNTNEILVGNHTWKAATLLGWEEISATFIEVDDVEARRIVLVDNRTSDLATYDSESLTDLLRSVARDLTGTGFDGDDLDSMIAGTAPCSTKPAKNETRIVVDKWVLKYPTEVFQEWERTLGPDPHDTIAKRLELPSRSWTPTT
jgi:hypothetical protein